MKRIVKTVLPDDFTPQILEEYLAKRFTYRNLTEWQSEIASGKLEVNSEISGGGRMLFPKDEIIYHAPERPEPEVDPDYKIVYEDDDLLVIDKPGLLPVHPAGIYFRHTLWYLLLEKYPAVYPVNRLDRETSGLMIVAKKPQIQAKIKILEKSYLAAVHGSFENAIDADGFLFIRPGGLIRKKRTFAFEAPDGIAFETARTGFFPFKPGKKISVVKAVLFTGRTHQIRATLEALNFPVVGDKMYGLDENFFLKSIAGTFDKSDMEKLRLPHQALHSAFLKFIRPGSREIMVFQSAPEWLDRFPE